MEDGLDLVIGRVGDRDVRAVLLSGGAVKELIAEGAGRLFKAKSLILRVGENVDGLNRDRETKSLAEFASPGRITLRGSRTHSMIEVGGDDPEPSLIGQCV